MEDCLFCKIIAGQIPGDKVYENEFIYAFRDIDPQAPTHVLIVPKDVYKRQIARTVELEMADNDAAHFVLNDCGMALQNSILQWFLPDAMQG